MTFASEEPAPQVISEAGSMGKEFLEEVQKVPIIITRLTNCSSCRSRQKDALGVLYIIAIGCTQAVAMSSDG